MSTRRADTTKLDHYTDKRVGKRQPYKWQAGILWKTPTNAASSVI